MTEDIPVFGNQVLVHQRRLAVREGIPDQGHPALYIIEERLYVGLGKGKLFWADVFQGDKEGLPPGKLYHG